MEKKTEPPAHTGSNAISLREKRIGFADCPVGAMMGSEELLGIGIKRAGRNFKVSLLEGNAGTEPPAWKRTLAKLVEEKVVLEPEEGKALIEKEGDVLLYDVLNLSKSVPSLVEIDKRTGIACDVTVLRHGVISTGGFGELFPTYGHAHEAKLGEIYSVIAGNGYLLQYWPETNLTRAVKMGKGDEHYIPPGWIHRFYCGTEGVVVAGFVPHAAGHDYGAVKGKGFPYHIFYDVLRNETIFRHNPNFGPAQLNAVEAQKNPIGAIARYVSAPEGLRALLETQD